MVGLLVVPLLLFFALLALLLPALSLALDLTAGVLLAVHLLLFVAILVLRARLVRSGRLGRVYAEQFSDWRRWAVRAAGWALILGAVWEGLMTLLCLAWLILRPLQIFL